MTTQLVLNQRGSSVSVSGGRYRIRTREQEFFLPVHEVSSIVLHAATRLSHDVVMTAIGQDTDILFVDRRGFPTGRVWSNRFGSIATIRKHQLTFAQSRAGGEWIRGLLLRKLENQAIVLDLLGTLMGDTYLQDIEPSLHALDRYAQKMRNVPVDDLSECFATFRGLEGSAGRVYFTQLNACLPVAYRFEKRSGRGATDSFNCLLNYAYGMLYGQCESALIQAGVDPFVGVMHRDEYNRPVLTYDFIEPFRAWADYVVCHLLMQEIVFDEFFDQESGGMYLNTTGKRILIQAMNDYLSEVIQHGKTGLARSRGQHIVLEAQQLASVLKKLDANDPAL
ncbi:CRISPR-associated endonuclease Cas1 [Fibrella arboris]|uniref:CRISPR-associated endonuclease Cas1 n=1 Tax=Fibrella arboris TaxID=3242486 RepID=UPI0035227168